MVGHTFKKKYSYKEVVVIYIPIFFGLFIIFVIWFQYKLRHASKNYDKEFSASLEDEIKTTYSRKKDISQDLFFIPQMDRLPVLTYDKEQEKHEGAAKKQLEVVIQSEKKMIRFDKPMTNREIKLAFGTINLEFIAEYEENFTVFLQKLNQWGEALIKEGNFSDAEILLNECVRIGSDISNSYMLLADVYSMQNSAEKLADLRETVERSNLLMKDKIISYINNCVSSF